MTSSASFDYDRTFFAVGKAARDFFDTFVERQYDYSSVIADRMLVWDEVQSGRNERGRWILGRIPGGSMARVQLDGKKCLSGVTYIDGPTAWAASASRDGPSKTTAKLLGKVLLGGARLDDVCLERLPVEQKWAVERDDTATHHYLILRPPALVVVVTDPHQHIVSYQTYNHTAAAKLMLEKISKYSA